MTDEEKVQAFLRTKGATPCPPMLAEDAHRQAGAVSRRGREAKPPHSPYELMPERRLAHAVILTMLCDLGGRTTGEGEGAKYKLAEEARRWFSRRGGLDEWCEIAGFDPDYIRRKASEVVQSGLPGMRAAHGTHPDYLKRRIRRQQKKGPPGWGDARP